MQSLQQETTKPVGRILTWGNEGKATCDLSLEIREGDIVSYTDPMQRVGICRIEQIRNAGPVGGIRGIIKLIGKRTGVPAMTPIYRYDPPKVTGALVELGSNQDENLVKVRVNAFFQHTMFAGKTMMGKTNFAIATAEELALLRVPNLIVDPQGEFTNLKELGEYVEVVQDTDDMLEPLRQRKTVVLNLLDLSDTEKVETFSKAVNLLVREKEAAYKKSNTKSRFFPPVIVTVDEAEIFAPESTWFKEQQPSRALLTDLVKRRAKFGIGAILLIQRFANFCTEIRSQCRNVAAFCMTESGDLQSLSSFVGQKLKRDELQSLKEGECVLAGGWVEYPTTIRTRKITTPRTKSLDFESLLELGCQEYKASLPTSRPELQREEENEDTHVCGDCREKCKTQTSKGHPDVDYDHKHYVCPKCFDEYCTVLERWVQTPARLQRRRC